ncbi:translation initiation factor IF-2-like [Varanus komodoensis]|uniref:translation initiation factor IF-2-like n=1 Tax=Varanus komodoensis TaxID=61221 RepID=UPI001CF7D49B|nr:translation initiation factor IF-2-like [Varanus komodoensis]
MSGGLGGMTAEQLLQQRLLRSRLRSSQHQQQAVPPPHHQALIHGHPGLGVGGPLPPPLLPPPCPLSPPSPPDSPPPGTTPAEIPAGPRYPSETWCSLCRVYCPDPVCLPCGHNFCTACIGQRLGEPKLNISCLECGATARKRNLRPIKPPPLLASLVVERPKRQRLDSAPTGAAVAAAPPLQALAPPPAAVSAPPPPAAAPAPPPPPPLLQTPAPPTPPSPAATAASSATLATTTAPPATAATAEAAPATAATAEAPPATAAAAAGPPAAAAGPPATAAAAAGPPATAAAAAGPPATAAAAAAARPSISAAGPSISAAGPPAAAARPSISAAGPSISAAGPPAAAARPSISAAGPSISAARPPAAAAGPSISVVAPPAAAATTAGPLAAEFPLHTTAAPAAAAAAGEAPPAAAAAAPPKRAPVTTGGGGDASGGRLCEVHREVLQFFCEEDQTPICAQCDRSQEHRAHTIFHVERAARDYRERVQTQLEILKQEKNTLWSQKLIGEMKIQEYTEKVQAERKEILSEFERLHQFLKDQEQRLLTQLEELDKQLAKQKNELITHITEELCRVGRVIAEMEVKCRQPASEFLQMYFQVLQPDLKAVAKLAWMTPFLQVHVGTHRVWLPCRPLGLPVVCSVVNINYSYSKDGRLVCFLKPSSTSCALDLLAQNHFLIILQPHPPPLVLEQTPDVPPLGSQDIKKNMSRCLPGQFPSSDEACSKLEKRLEDISRKGAALKETLNRFQDNIRYAVDKGETVKTLNDKVNMALDVPSALLSLDQRNMGYDEPRHRLPALEYVPDVPKNLDSRALVLGCDGFTSGRYFWELEVGDGEFWAVGVTRDPAKKKGMMDFSPEEGIWAVGLWKGQHWALTSPVTALSLSQHPRRIRVSLDYVGECVTFTDADTDGPIFTFPPASFNGARTHPLLWVVGFPAQSVFLRRMGVKYPTGVHEMDVLSP